MWWALLWAVIIGGITTHDDLGAGAVLAFFVIWYFVHEAKKYKSAAESMVVDIERLQREKLDFERKQ